MKYLNTIAPIFARIIVRLFVLPLCGLIAGVANAYVVTDVKTINQTIASGSGITWEYDFADFGFVPGRDSLVSEAWIRIEIRDPDYRPDKEESERPFVIFYFGHRDYMRVGMEDWVGTSSYLYEDSKMSVALRVAEHEIWIGNATLTFEFVPGPAQVPEPAPVLLFAFSLLVLGLSRRRHQKNALKSRNLTLSLHYITSCNN